MAHPYRIACLRIPRFQIAVHRKVDPALKGKPFVVISGAESNGAQVFSCSFEASQQRVCSGMKLSEARAVCSELIAVEYDERLYEQVQRELAAQLLGCSPRVAAGEPGLFILDASGLKHLGGERGFCEMARRIMVAAGFADIRLGIADGSFAAMAATRLRRKQFFSVIPGEDRQFLNSLSVLYLPQKLGLQDTLLELGIRTIGAFMALPQEAVMERFGDSGRQALALIEGREALYPCLPREEKKYECRVELSGPVQALEEVRFLVRSMVNRLTEELKQDGYCAEELTLSFYCDTVTGAERKIPLIKPGNHTKFLHQVIMLSLESCPPEKEFSGFSLSVSRYARQMWRQEKLQPARLRGGQEKLVAGNQSVNPGESLTVLMQKFMAYFSKNALVRPFAGDEYLPEKAGCFVPVGEEADILPVDINYASEKVGPAGLVSSLVLKKFSAPENVLVELAGEMPKSVTYKGSWYRVKEVTTPEKLSGLWWENPVQKVYYVALLESHADIAALSRAGSDKEHGVALLSRQCYLVLLVHNHDLRSWTIEGVFD